MLLAFSESSVSLMDSLHLPQTPTPYLLPRPLLLLPPCRRSSPLPLLRNQSRFLPVFFRASQHLTASHVFPSQFSGCCPSSRPSPPSPPASGLSLQTMQIPTVKINRHLSQFSRQFHRLPRFTSSLGHSWRDTDPSWFHFL